MNSSEKICQFLTWDSDFFGQRIARLSRTRLTPATVAEADAWCVEQCIDCLYFLADSNDDETVRLAENHGFHLVDLRLTLTRRIAPQQQVFTSAHDCIRFCRDFDIPFLKDIARSNHLDTRFYFDRNFQRSKCDELYSVWIENSCNGFADAVLVVGQNDVAAGYLTCHLKEKNSGQIGLVGIGPSSQGKGFGAKLIEESLRWFAAQGVEQVEVVTQGRNVPAQRLYQKNGFCTASIGLWYHKWYRTTSRIS